VIGKKPVGDFKANIHTDRYMYVLFVEKRDGGEIKNMLDTPHTHDVLWILSLSQISRFVLFCNIKAI
jgi:hypothetical protein